jgi:hypothetical protein
LLCGEAIYAYFVNEAKNINAVCVESGEFQNAEITAEL